MSTIYHYPVGSMSFFRHNLQTHGIEATEMLILEGCKNSGASNEQYNNLLDILYSLTWAVDGFKR